MLRANGGYTIMLQETWSYGGAGYQTLHPGTYSYMYLLFKFILNLKFRDVCDKTYVEHLCMLMLSTCLPSKALITILMSINFVINYYNLYEAFIKLLDKGTANT